MNNIITSKSDLVRESPIFSDDRDWCADDISDDFPYLKLGKNWVGGLSEHPCFSEWRKKCHSAGNEYYQRFFFFRREAKALMKIYIWKYKKEYIIGFRQEDGRSSQSDIIYQDLETAKEEAMKFFINEFFRKLGLSLKKQYLKQNKKS